jgi:arylsulfatase
MSFDWAQNVDPDADGYTGTLNYNCLTIAEALEAAGYRSYLSGKWHVTSRVADKATWPCSRGFDRSFTLISGATDYFHPRRLALDDRFYIAPEKTYFTDLVGTYAERFVEEHFRDHAGSPLFLYLPFTAPHFPIQAPEQTVAKYRGIYAVGWDVLRDQRFHRMRELGVTRSEWELPPRPDTVTPWECLGPEEKRTHIEMMATYAAMIEIMDANVGRVIRALERHRALENTLIMFLSDNGACAEGPPMGSETKYGECWAHLSNTPFRLYKHFTTQGGVQTPFIAQWPAGIAGDRKKQAKATGSLLDVMPTCLQLAGAAYPESRNGHRLHPLDGVSLVPLLRGARWSGHPDIFVEHEGNRMVRSGSHKLVRQHTEPLWQLYDMDRDRSEMHDMASEDLETFVELSRRYERWAAAAHVLPWSRVGKYVEYHGHGSVPGGYSLPFDQALERARPEEVVDGGEAGD